MSLRPTLLTAFIVASAAVLLATWLTSGQLEPVSGKSLFIGALLVVPFVVSAKYEIAGVGALAFAFFTYFAIAFAVIWLVFRNKRV